MYLGFQWTYEHIFSPYLEKLVLNTVLFSNLSDLFLSIYYACLVLIVSLNIDKHARILILASANFPIF